jgi:hypothetical protein
MWLELERQRSRKPPHAGANPAVGSATSRWCSGWHWTLRRSRSWFDSRSGYGPASVLDSTAVFETARRGSIPRRGTFILGVWRIAHDPAKVGDQVRLLTRILDAGAKWRGNRLQPGPSGFDSHRRLWNVKCLRRPVRSALGVASPPAGSIPATLLERVYNPALGPLSR